MTPSCKLFSRTFEGSVDSQIMIDFIDEYAVQINKRTILVLDNAPIHKSKKFLANIDRWRELDIEIFFLPTYSPELNKIEILWRFIKYKWIPLDAYLNFNGISHQITSSIFLFFSCNTLLKTDSEYEILSRIRMKPNFKSVLFLRFNSLEILK